MQDGVRGEVLGEGMQERRESPVPLLAPWLEEELMGEVETEAGQVGGAGRRRESKGKGPASGGVAKGAKVGAATKVHEEEEDKVTISYSVSPGK